MGHTLVSEALVLKTWDVGDADRLCVLLTAREGRLAMVAKGVRKLQSKWSGAIQSFQHVRVDLAEHSSGYILRSAECLSSFEALRRDMEKFSLASEGSELLLRLLHDTDADEAVFRLAREFFSSLAHAASPLLLPLFQLSLLSLLGLLPSPGDADIPASLRTHVASSISLRERALLPLSREEHGAIRRLADRYLCDHLASPLKARAAGCSLGSQEGMLVEKRRGSSGGTPISSIVGRAS